MTFILSWFFPGSFLCYTIIWYVKKNLFYIYLVLGREHWTVSNARRSVWRRWRRTGSHQGPSRGRRMLYSLLKHLFEGTWKRGCRNCSICDTLSRSGQNTSFLKIENNYPAKNLPGIRFSQGVSLLMQNGLESDVVTNTGTIGHKMVSLHIKGQHHKKIGRSPSTMLNPSLCLNDDQHKEPMIDTKII